MPDPATTSRGRTVPRRPRAEPPDGTAAAIACIVGPDPGHALPVLAIASRLRQRGHRVTVWTGQRHRDLAAAHDLGWCNLPLLAPLPGDHDIGVRLHARSVGMAEALLPEVAAVEPDLLVVDTLTRAGALVAARLEVPYLEIVPHHLPDPAPDLPPVGLGRAMPRNPWRRFDDRIIVRRQLASLADGRAQAAAAAAAFGLSAPPRPARRLLQTLPSLERPRSSWPEDATIVGPLALDLPGPTLAPPDGDAPLVLVTDSTASGLDRSLAEVALDGLDGLELRVAVTSGRLPPQRTATTVVGTGPHAPLLAEAAVAVSPGGGGFITKAAAAAVPQVVVPLAGDQREAAARLRDAGVARIVRPRRYSPRALRWAVVTLLADRRARARAHDLADEARRLGPEVAADHCLDVLATTRTGRR